MLVYIVVRNGYLKVVDFFIFCGVDIDVVDKDGWNVLYFVC